VSARGWAAIVLSLSALALGASGCGGDDEDETTEPTISAPPPAGSPQEQFERFCQQNPQACG